MSEYVMEVEYDTMRGTFSQKRKEEIVRCRDCRSAEEHCDGWFCHHFSMFDRAGWPIRPDGFCAWGERREQ